MAKRPHRWSAGPIAAIALALTVGACAQEEAAAPGQAADLGPPASVTADTPVVAVGDQMANFTLTDQHGVSHELYAKSDADAVVLVMQGNGCPIVQKMLPTLMEVADDYTSRNVEFVMINSNFQDSPEKILAETEKFSLDLPILKDSEQTIGKYLGAVRTAEVFIIDTADWNLVYHGPIDDRLTYGREKAEADHHYVRATLDAVLAGEPLPYPEAQQADGCLINYV